MKTKKLKTALLRRRVRCFTIALLFFGSLLLTSGAIGEGTPIPLFSWSNSARAQTLSERSILADVQSVVLDNGLTVLMKPVHSTANSASVISVDVVYGVGSVDEGKDEIQISHMLEHLLLRGIGERPVKFSRLFHALGSEFNGINRANQTDFFHLFTGRDELNAILTLEADRMLNTQITAEALAAEKKVVSAELKVTKRDQPTSLLNKALFEAAYPDRNLGHLFTAAEADVESLTQPQVEAFYKKYYNPSNATLIVSGDFDANDTLSHIETVFGSLVNSTTAIPKSTGRVKPVDAIPMAAQADPLVLQLPDAPSIVKAVFPSPNFMHPDSPAIALLETTNSSVGLSCQQLREFGWCSTVGKLEPEQPIAASYESMQQALEKLMKQTIDSAELSAAKEHVKSQILSKDADVSAQTGQLGKFQTVAGDYRAIDDYLAAIEAVTPKDMQRVAQTYLTLDKAVVGLLKPTAGAAQSPSPSPPTVSTVPAKIAMPEAFESLPDVSEHLPLSLDSRVELKQALPEKWVLDNGLQVLLLQDGRTPGTVAMRSWVDAGDRFDPEGKAGTARLTANSLVDSIEHENTLSFAIDTDIDGANLSADVQIENLQTGLETLANYLQRATFSTDSFEKKQPQLREALAKSLKHPYNMSNYLFRQALYSEGHSAYQMKTDKSLAAISPTDLQTFYHQHYRPDSTIITLAGAFDPLQVKSQIEQVLGNWQAKGEAPVLALSPVPAPKSSLYIEQPLADSPVVEIAMGHRSISRSDPRYYAFTIVNDILGGMPGTGHLGLRLRDQQGLLYTVESRLDAKRDSGEFVITMDTPTENVDRAIGSAIAVLRQLKTEGITESELQSAKQSLTSQYLLDLDFSNKAADIVLDNAINQLDESELATYLEKIQAVTLEDTKAAIETLLDSDGLIVVMSGAVA